jgi:hypothetical protein
MRTHTGLLEWDHDDSIYAPGWIVGSEGDNGEHIRDESGWPYSIYRKTDTTGRSDYVLCHGIQNKGDAYSIVRMLNARLGIDRYRS